MNPHNHQRILACLTLATSLIACNPTTIGGPTGGDAYTVNTASDTLDIKPGDGFCADTTGKCSLRAAILESNARAGAQSISVPTLTIVLSRAGVNEDQAQTGDLNISGELSISGDTAGGSVIDGNALDRIFAVNDYSKAKLTLKNMTLRNGNSGVGGAIYVGIDNSLTGSNLIITANTSTSSGGGIYSRGTGITLSDSSLSQNTATTGGAIGLSYYQGSSKLSNIKITKNTASKSGGAIELTEGILNITSSNISENTAQTGSAGALSLIRSTSIIIENTTFARNAAPQSYGGAISLDGGTLSLTSSLLEANTAQNGAGIGSDDGTISVINSTLSGNIASAEGGGIWVYSSLRFSPVSITSSTMAGNQAAAASGGSLSANYSIALKNSILAAANGNDCSLNSLGPITSAGGNIISDATCALGSADKQSTNAQLATLADNGGPTRTFMPASSSPAIDSIDSSLCVATDARGVARPQGLKCDAGAVERRAGATP